VGVVSLKKLLTRVDDKCLAEMGDKILKLQYLRSVAKQEMALLASKCSQLIKPSSEVVLDMVDGGLQIAQLTRKRRLENTQEGSSKRLCRWIITLTSNHATQSCQNFRDSVEISWPLWEKMKWHPWRTDPFYATAVGEAHCGRFYLIIGLRHFHGTCVDVRRWGYMALQEI